MPQLAAFPKAWLDYLCVSDKMSLREWVELAASLGVDGLEFYSGFRELADPDREVDTDVLVVGDDPAARAVVIGLADVIPGCRGIDAGPLRLARYLEGLTAVVVSVNRRYKIHAGVRITRLSEERRLRLAPPPAGEEGS